MTPAAFSQRFPEFAEVGASLIEAKLQEAASLMGGPDVTVWGPCSQPGQPPALADTAQGYLAAALLWESPSGGATLLLPKGGKVHYRTQYQEIVSGVCHGPLVAGNVAFANPGLSVPTTGLTPGAGTVSLLNGSPNVTFAQTQTLAKGTLITFPGVQPGVLYVLQANLVIGVAGALSAAYSGPTTPNAAWSY